MHGISLNVNVDLSYYKNIVSCGIKDPKYSVTSMQAELKKPVCLNMVWPLTNHPNNFTTGCI